MVLKEKTLTRNTDVVNRMLYDSIRTTETEGIKAREMNRQVDTIQKRIIDKTQAETPAKSKNEDD